MVTISDSVDIAVTPAEVWAWLCELPAHYVEWHPAHHECEVLRGRVCEPGAVLEMEEDLHGKRHRLRMRVLSVTRGREVSYRVAFWLRGRFRVDPVGDGCRFTAETSLGVPGPGGLLDRPLTWLFRRRIAALEQHQREEGQSLKRLLERGSTG